MSAPTGRNGRDKPDPYTSFKNDRARLWALVSRDLRLVLCTVVIAIGAPSISPSIANLLLKASGW